MKPGDEFAQFVTELFSNLGRVSTRRMFGGRGVYCDGLMFALIHDEVVYLKADEVSRPRYEAAGCTPLVVPMRGKLVAMSYWRAPDDAMESPALAAPWARLAFESALRRANAPGHGRKRAAIGKPGRPTSGKQPATSKRGKSGQ